MAFTEADLQERLAALREQGRKALETYNQEFEEHYGWLNSVLDGLKNCTINVQTVLVPKTPGKRQAPLSAINESLESSIEIEDVKPVRISAQSKRASRKGQSKKAASKLKKVPIIEEDDDDVEFSAPTKPQKRLSEEAVDNASKRLCGNRTSETTSRDSGLSSVGSRNTRGRSLGGFAVKQEVLTPKNTSTNSTVSEEEEDEEGVLSVDGDSSSATSRDPSQSGTVPQPSKKRSRSTGRDALVIKEEPRRSSRCHSEPRTPNAKRPSIGSDKTLIITSEARIVLSPYKGSPILSPKNQGNFRSPIVKAPPSHLLKGESVKKAVKAFEALNEEQETELPVHGIIAPLMPPPSKLLPPSKTTATSNQSSLDDALNAPTRVTRTKTRAMAKAAADETKKITKDDPNASTVSKILKSPVHYQQKKTTENRVDVHHEKENSTIPSSRIVTKPFGSASKQPQFFLKASTPLRITPLTPSHAASTSFTAPRINNLVTSVESFILKPVVNQEVKPSREENLQKLVAKAEVASKKKEEIMKAQMEERIKKRQEKRLKVCAAREAMEKEKLEMLQKLEREREEKQKQLQAEREEKLRQEYLKKKRLAQQKAAETEERRRQEEAARLAKLKQQEDEQNRIAAQRKKEQEEADKRQQERMQQEREAAALRAKEADRLAKEASIIAKKTSKVQLDQTYDKLSPGPQTYGMTPGPEEREPIPNTNPDNYGIEDAGTDDSSEDEAKPKKVVPLWAQPKHRIHKLMEDYEINHHQMFVFFGSKKSTPDLSKIFVAIDRRQLIRKSSAVWRTPPVKY